MKKSRLLLSAFLLAGIQIGFCQPLNITVDVKKPGAPIQKTMYGIFFEDINYGADGGLYAEKIKNRSFEYTQALLGWTSFGKVEVLTDGAPFPNNPHYVRLSYPGHNDKRSGLDNEGYFGVSVEKNVEYRFSVWARAIKDSSAIRIEIVDNFSNIIAFQQLKIQSKDWKKYQITLKSTSTELKGRLRLFLASNNPVDLEHVSLFPVDTWKGRENGLRKDLAQALYDLRPGVFRFPGGCIVEGTTIEDRYQWKNSVGPVENRKLNENRWQFTFTNRFFPDYYQSYGLGFYEFFLLSEDIGSEPLPVLNCGMACQFQNQDKESAHIQVCDLDSYVQDALDLIEFANGDTTTHWGKLRAQMGHPAPFHLKMMAIGNEQWGSLYPERLEPFIKAIRAKYPTFKIIGSSGPYADGKEFDYGWKEMKRLKVDLVDEHYYKSPEWFLANASRYDNYDRKGPKVFAGEYACHVKDVKNSFYSALCEAAMMTGLERNADIVHQCTYAPLFAHVNGWQWRPDLIWFDNLKTALTPNYYVQQLYGNYHGTNVLQTLKNKLPLTGQDGIYASSSIDKDKNEIYMKIVNTSDSPKKVSYSFNGLKPAERTGKHIVLQSANQNAENSIEHPTNVIPVTQDIQLKGNTLDVELAAKSFNLFVIRL